MLYPMLYYELVERRHGSVPYLWFCLNLFFVEKSDLFDIRGVYKTIFRVKSKVYL